MLRESCNLVENLPTTDICINLDDFLFGYESANYVMLSLINTEYLLFFTHVNEIIGRNEK